MRRVIGTSGDRKSKSLPLINADDTDQKKQNLPRRHGGTEKKQEKPLKHGGMEVTEKAFAADLRR
jgi:hypothetical protein